MPSAIKVGGNHKNLHSLSYIVRRARLDLILKAHLIFSPSLLCIFTAALISTLVIHQEVITRETTLAL